MSTMKQQVTRFNELLLQCQSMFATFFYRDRFPLVGWLLDVLNGSMARLEKNFKDMDEFYQELIDEHVNRTETEQ
ncbi:hypothetical protein HanPSC8_Chr12g0532061 [Helianthus annuus]|nr:hypothetical protein HanPSC8_Chr12g0532061 [Helianthus annuus]